MSEEEKLLAIRTLRDLQWHKSSELLIAVFSGESTDVQCAILDALGLIRGRGIGSFLRRYAFDSDCERLIWPAVNSLIAADCLRTSDLPSLLKLLRGGVTASVRNKPESRVPVHLKEIALSGVQWIAYHHRGQKTRKAIAEFLHPGLSAESPLLAEYCNSIQEYLKNKDNG